MSQMKTGLWSSVHDMFIFHPAESNHLMKVKKNQVLKKVRINMRGEAYQQLANYNRAINVNM